MYATIRDMVPQTHNGVPTLEQMQEAVGGYICTAERIRLTAARCADVWCNDEGLLMGLPLTYINRHGSPIVGDLIITGADNEGETIALTQTEIDFVLSNIGFGRIN